MIDLTQTPKRLKQSILMEAMQGKLTKQLPSDGNAGDLLVKIANYKRNLVQSGKLKGYSKPLPSIKKNEEPFSIPDNWQWTRLSAITPVTLGKTPARHNTSYWNGNIPWVSIADLNNGIVSDTKEDITSKAANKIFHNDITPAGSLLMSFKLTIGKMGILKYPAYHNEAIVSFKFFVHRTNKIILRNYLYYTLPLLTTFVRSTSAIKGNTLNKSKLKRMLIPLPPLAEQKRIVQRLDQILPKIDGLNKDVVRLHSIRKSFPHRLKQSLLMEAMQGKLTKQLPSDGNAEELLQKIQQKKQALIKAGKIRRHKKLPPISKDEIPFKIPKNWKWVRLADISNVVMGQSPKRNTVSTNPVDNTHFEFHQGKSLFGKTYLHKSNKVTTSNSKVIKPNTIVMSVRAPVGNINITYRTIAIGRGLCGISPYVNLNYIYWFLFSQKHELRDRSTGTTFKAINKTNIEQFPCPLPPLAEQERIVKKLHDLFVE